MNILNAQVPHAALRVESQRAIICYMTFYGTSTTTVQMSVDLWPRLKQKVQEQTKKAACVPTVQYQSSER
jgi:hypothetical protein